MTAEFRAPSTFVPVRSSERMAPDSASFADLRVRVATALRAQADPIASRWSEQSRMVALRDASTPRDTEAVAAMVESLALALSADDAASDELVAQGLALGAQAFATGASLHHTLKALHLLSAMVLYAAETSVAEEASGTAAEGIHVTRLLQQSASRMTIAVTRGYTLCMTEAMRDRFRRLRHDLRNPLGTIKSVLAMMEDETLPAEQRTHPRFRAMAKRNARSLGDLITDRLSDAEAVTPALARQSVSLRTVACGVRRDLRAIAGARHVTVAIGPMEARVVTDAIGFELALHELLLAALRESTAGEELSLELAEVREGRARIRLTCAPARRPVCDTASLDHLSAIARQLRGALDVDAQALTLAVPVQRIEAASQTADVPAAVSVAKAADARPSAGNGSGGREPGHDVRGSRERDHGESGAL